jgi:hypothetical protein
MVATNSFRRISGSSEKVEIREYFIPDFSDWKNHDS